MTMTGEKDEGLGSLLHGLAERIAKEKINIRLMEDIEFPLEIMGVDVGAAPPLLPDLHKVGALVRVRPVSKDGKEKTYLGIYLGDMYHPSMTIQAFQLDAKKVRVLMRTNPAIFVPDLERTNDIWRRRIAVTCDDVPMEDHVRDGLIYIISKTVGTPKPCMINGRWIPEDLEEEE